MAQTTTFPTRPSPSAAILMNLFATLLEPIFLGVTRGDAGLARMAATETINAYRAQNLSDLIAIAQIIAYARPLEAAWPTAARSRRGRLVWTGGLR